MPWKQSFWKDVIAPTTVRIAAPAIAAILGTIAVALFTPLFSWLAEDVAIPRWWFWVSSLGFVGGGCLLAYQHLRHLFFPSYRSYTHDNFCGILWRWEWSKRGVYGIAEPRRIVPHCPECDIQLRYQQGLINLGVGPSKAPTYQCTACGKESYYVPPEEATKRIIKVTRDRGWT